jgi:hypothetical protein
MYIRGYPSRCVWMFIRAAFPMSLFALPTLAASGIGAWTFFHLHRQSPSFPYLIILILLVAIFGVVMIIYIRVIAQYFQFRIVPYFEARVRIADSFKDDPFFSGYAMARHCKELDRLARRHDRPTLSSFGFKDEFLGGWPDWHDPAKGLEAIDFLIKNMPRTSELRAVRSDLEKLIEPLRSSAIKDIRFCLVIRCGYDDVVSLSKMENRNKGSYW